MQFLGPILEPVLETILGLLFDLLTTLLGIAGLDWTTAAGTPQEITDWVEVPAA